MEGNVRGHGAYEKGEMDSGGGASTRIALFIAPFFFPRERVSLPVCIRRRRRRMRVTGGRMLPFLSFGPVNGPSPPPPLGDTRHVLVFAARPSLPHCPLPFFRVHPEEFIRSGRRKKECVSSTWAPLHRDARLAAPPSSPPSSLRQKKKKSATLTFPLRLLATSTTTKKKQRRGR